MKLKNTKLFPRGENRRSFPLLTGTCLLSLVHFLSFAHAMEGEEIYPKESIAYHMTTLPGLPTEILQTEIFSKLDLRALGCLARTNPKFRREVFSYIDNKIKNIPLEQYIKELPEHLGQDYFLGLYFLKERAKIEKKPTLEVANDIIETTKSLNIEFLSPETLPFEDMQWTTSNKNWRRFVFLLKAADHLGNGQAKDLLSTETKKRWDAGQMNGSVAKVLDPKEQKDFAFAAHHWIDQATLGGGTHYMYKARDWYQEFNGVLQNTKLFDNYKAICKHFTKVVKKAAVIGSIEDKEKAAQLLCYYNEKEYATSLMEEVAQNGGIDYKRKVCDWYADSQKGNNFKQAETWAKKIAEMDKRWGAHWFFNQKNSDNALNLFEELRKTKALTSNDLTPYIRLLKLCGIDSLDLSENIKIYENQNTLAENLENNNSFKSLNLAGTGLTDKIAKIILKPLRKSETLSSLNLEGNVLTAAGMKEISKLFRHGTPIMELKIGKNPIGNEGIAVLARTLKSDKIKLNSLWINEITETLQDARALSETLKNLFSPEKKAFSLKTKRKKICHLKTLNLNGNAIGELGMANIKEAFREQAPSEIYLAGISIGKEALLSIAEMLESNHKITLLDLSSNKIGDAEFRELQSALLSNVKFRNLKIILEGIDFAESTKLSLKYLKDKVELSGGKLDVIDGPLTNFEPKRKSVLLWPLVRA